MSNENTTTIEPPSAAEVRSSDRLESRCNCIEEYSALIKKEYGEDAELELVMKFNIQTGKMWASFPPIYFKHRVKNAAGKLTSKTKRSHFKSSYCALCGKAL